MHGLQMQATDKMSTSRVPINFARICRDCDNLVTTMPNCPLCDKPTVPHPDRNEKESWCQGCAGGLFAASTMHLVTWNENPYVQDDGDLYLLCPECLNQEKSENW